MADRVNLGLLPTAETSYETACKALKENGGMLHIHANVDLKKKYSTNEDSKIEVAENIKWKHESWRFWSLESAQKIDTIIKDLNEEISYTLRVVDFTKVKSYGPKIDHVVLDLKIAKN